MRSFLRLFLVTCGLVLAIPATAAIYTVDPINGYDCAGSMTTDGCFSDPTATSVTGPTVTACIAIGSQKQGCRSCEPAFYDNGKPKGYAVCAYVPWSAGCSCDKALTPDCVEKASCTFYNR